MDRDIYENRAQQLDDLITALIDSLEQSWNGSKFVSDEEGDKPGYILSQIERMVKLEQANANVLLKSEESDLKDRELTLQEVVSDENRKAAERSDETKRLEIDVRKQELETNKSSKSRELDIRQREYELDVLRQEGERQDAASKEAIDQTKLKTEAAAVKGRVIGEAISAIAGVVGTIGTLLALRTAIQFEHDDKGGILPAKFISTIFKMAK